MAVTKAQLVEDLNHYLMRSETVASLEAELRDTIINFGQMARWPCLYEGDGALLAEGEAWVAAPTDLHSLDTISPWDGEAGDIRWDPMERERWIDLAVGLSGETPPTGRPSKFCMRGTQYIFDVAADRDYWIFTLYWKNPETDEATLDFPDHYRPALASLLQANYLAGLGLQTDPKCAQLAARFNSQLALLMPEADHKVRAAVYGGL